jgi:S1-C subfamily serine protease
MAPTQSICPQCGKPVLWFGTTVSQRVPCPHCKGLLESTSDGLRVAGPIKASYSSLRPVTVRDSAGPLPLPLSSDSLAPVRRRGTRSAAQLMYLVLGIGLLAATAGTVLRDRPPGNTASSAAASKSAAEAPAALQGGRSGDGDQGRTAGEPRRREHSAAATASPQPASAGVLSGPRGRGISRVVARVRPSVVTIVAGTDATPEGLGSGFVVAKRRWIATNLHVVSGNNRAVAVRKIDDGSDVAIEVAGFVACNPRVDLVLLALEKEWPWQPLDLAAGVPRLGEDVFAIGTPKGLAETITKGIVSQVRSAGDIGSKDLAPATRIIQSDAFVTHGNSGGPLCAADGRVLGINTFVMKDDESQSVEFHFAVSAQELAKLIDGAGSEVLPLSSLPSSRR